MSVDIFNHNWYSLP